MNSKHFPVIIAFLVILMTTQTLEARRAILVANYGSSRDETRIATIDKITSQIRETFPTFEVREAYISDAVRHNLAKKGIKVESPSEALLRLCVDGYDSIYVQSTTLIDGIEMAEVKKSAEAISPFFKYLKIGEPLLYTPDDCREVVEILSRRQCAEDEWIIYVGHGNMLPSTATYSQLDYMFGSEGLSHFHVSTIEGYPDVGSTLAILKADSTIKRLTLIPLLLVCGNHTLHDIAEDYAGVLKSAGYSAEVLMQGLGEVPEIRSLYVERVRKLIGQ